jgi:aryl sulfotransferase
MDTSLPRLTRTYRNHHLDSRRWQRYEPQEGDVVVSTAYKAGTTWTQAIVLALLDPDSEEVPNVSAHSPWPDRRFGQDDATVARLLAARTPGRPMCLKTHLPLDALPYHQEVRYLVVGRDPRDVFMSLFNHYGNYNALMFSRLNDAGCVGDPLPPCPGDPRVLWQSWITRGWFEWEEEGWPFWTNLGHTRSYWEFRQLPNLLFVHYGDMWEQPYREVARIARFIGVGDAPDLIERTIRRSRFDVMKENADKIQSRMNETWRGGASAFFHRGGGGRWRGVLTDDDLALYEEKKARMLEPACARWLEEGGEVPGIAPATGR